jgi:hypothetical protein
MALGTHIGVLADRIHGRVVVLDAGNGFTAVALAAGEIAPGCMDIRSLRWMAVFTPQVLVKLDSLV